MPTFPTIAAAAVAAAVAGHLWSEVRGATVARAALKLAASAGFLAFALVVTSGSRYAGFVVTGLALSAVGDALLLAVAKRAFLAGVGAFLLAHIAYAAAFAPFARPSAVVAAAFTIAGVGVVRWLWPHLGSLRAPIVVYAAAITVMIVLALGTPSALIRLGAALFYASDLTVARDRFVHPGVGNRLLGLPLYYTGQVLLAASTASLP